MSKFELPQFAMEEYTEVERFLVRHYGSTRDDMTKIEETTDTELGYEFTESYYWRSWQPFCQ